METPQKVDHQIADILWDIAEFIVRNLFGVLSAMAGIAYQIYQMSGRTRSMTKVQCVTSVFMWIIASMAIVIGMEGVGINKLFYGLICWATPIIVKPIADTLSIKASPVTEKIIKGFEKFIDSYTKKNT
jgi:hypothetical protein